MTNLDKLIELCNSSIIGCCRCVVRFGLHRIKKKTNILKQKYDTIKFYDVTSGKIIANKIAKIESSIEICQKELDKNIFKHSLDILASLECDLEDIETEYDKENVIDIFEICKEIQNEFSNLNHKSKNEIIQLIIKTTESFDKITKSINQTLDYVLPESKAIFNIGDTLYIYKGNILCHKYKHKIIQATAILHNQSDNEIKLNVEYCTECKKYFLDYTIFEHYRDKYGALIGNLRLVKNGEFTGSYELAQESPLHIIGYNVGQKDGFTEIERHYILAKVLYGRIMTKGEVIKYLSFFIRRNGAKNGNELAVSKWKSDLLFVQEYDIDMQPKAIITDIKKYKR